MTKFFLLAALIFTLQAQADDGPGQTSVQKGETLAAVSFRVYGTHKRWREIYEANKDAIPDMNKIEPGTVLKLPSPQTTAKADVAQDSKKVPTILPVKNSKKQQTEPTADLKHFDEMEIN